MRTLSFPILLSFLLLFSACIDLSLPSAIQSPDGPIYFADVPGRGGMGGNGQNGSGGVIFDAPRGAAETKLGTDGTIEVVDTPMLPGDSKNLDAISNAGGTPASGGVGSGGVIRTGGASGTGGVPVVCGTDNSTYNERILFKPNEGSSVLLTRPTPLPSGAQLIKGKLTSLLCLTGCDALKMNYTTGTALYTFVGVERLFDTPVNLTNSKISFSLTIDNPSNVPIEVKVYTKGDASTNWAWGPATTLSGETLAPYTTSYTFTDATLFPANGSVYCTSATKIVGLLIQNNQAITSANEGTVTVYLDSLTIRPAS